MQRERDVWSSIGLTDHLHGPYILEWICRESVSAYIQRGTDR